MRKILIFLLLVTGALQLNAQKKAAAAKARSSQPVTAAASHAGFSTAALPSKEVVEAFMKRMFGQDPTIEWRVVSITPSEIPNIAHVVVALGRQSQAIHLYVTPDGEHAIAGEVIPFGADPFAPLRKKLAAEAAGPRTGAANPTITFIEFSDLQCPHCKQAQPVLDRLMTDFPTARLVFQHFPLPMHDWAFKAAAFADCVAQLSQPAFWKFVNGIYGAQAEITLNDAESRFLALATSAGVDAARVSACAAQPETEKRVKQSMELGAAIGVSGTPTVFINGRKVPGIADIPYENLKSLIQFEMEQTAK